MPPLSLPLSLSLSLPLSIRRHPSRCRCLPSSNPEPRQDGLAARWLERDADQIWMKFKTLKDKQRIFFRVVSPMPDRVEGEQLSDRIAFTVSASVWVCVSDSLCACVCVCVCVCVCACLGLPLSDVKREGGFWRVQEQVKGKTHPHTEPSTCLLVWDGGQGGGGIQSVLSTYLLPRWVRESVPAQLTVNWLSWEKW